MKDMYARKALAFPYVPAAAVCVLVWAEWSCLRDVRLGCMVLLLSMMADETNDRPEVLATLYPSKAD